MYSLPRVDETKLEFLAYLIRIHPIILGLHWFFKTSARQTPTSSMVPWPTIFLMPTKQFYKMLLARVFSSDCFSGMCGQEKIISVSPGTHTGPDKRKKGEWSHTPSLSKSNSKITSWQSPILITTTNKPGYKYNKQSYLYWLLQAFPSVIRLLKEFLITEMEWTIVGEKQ